MSFSLKSKIFSLFSNIRDSAHMFTDLFWVLLGELQKLKLSTFQSSKSQTSDVISLWKTQWAGASHIPRPFRSSKAVLCHKRRQFFPLFLILYVPEQLTSAKHSQLFLPSSRKGPGLSCVSSSEAGLVTVPGMLPGDNAEKCFLLLKAATNLEC